MLQSKTPAQIAMPKLGFWNAYSLNDLLKKYLTSKAYEGLSLHINQWHEAQVKKNPNNKIASSQQALHYEIFCWLSELYKSGTQDECQRSSNILSKAFPQTRLQKLQSTIQSIFPTSGARRPLSLGLKIHAVMNPEEYQNPFVRIFFDLLTGIDENYFPHPSYFYTEKDLWFDETNNDWELACAYFALILEYLGQGRVSEAMSTTQGAITAFSSILSTTPVRYHNMFSAIYILGFNPQKMLSLYEAFKQTKTQYETVRSTVYMSNYDITDGGTLKLPNWSASFSFQGVRIEILLRKYFPIDNLVEQKTPLCALLTGKIHQLLGAEKSEGEMKIEFIQFAHWYYSNLCGTSHSELSKLKKLLFEDILGLLLDDDKALPGIIDPPDFADFKLLTNELEDFNDKNSFYQFKMTLEAPQSQDCQALYAQAHADFFHVCDLLAREQLDEAIGFIEEKITKKHCRDTLDVIGKIAKDDFSQRKNYQFAFDFWRSFNLSLYHLSINPANLQKAFTEFQSIQEKANIKSTDNMVVVAAAARPMIPAPSAPPIEQMTTSDSSQPAEVPYTYLPEYAPSAPPASSMTSSPISPTIVPSVTNALHTSAGSGALNAARFFVVKKQALRKKHLLDLSAEELNILLDTSNQPLDTPLNSLTRLLNN